MLLRNCVVPLVVVFGAIYFGQVQCMVLTSVNLLFETFTPYGMIKFFEFSDKGWNVTENCLKDMYNFLDGLQKDALWAAKLFDATSYYAGGAFGGNRFHMENSDLCRRLKMEHATGAGLNWNPSNPNGSVVPFDVQLVSATYFVEMGGKEVENFTVQQSICLPKSCGFVDLQQILTVNMFRNNRAVKRMSLTGVRLIDGGRYNVFDDASVYILTSVLTIVGFLYVIASLLDSIQDFLTVKGCGLDGKHTNDEMTSQPSEITAKDLQCAIEQLTKLSHGEHSSTAKLNLHPLAESMTINNISANSHVNLLKVKKFKTKNTATISLDIISGNSKAAQALSKSSDNIFYSLLSAFSWQKNYRNLTYYTTSDRHEIGSVRGLQTVCGILLIFAHTSLTLEYVANNRMMLPKGYTKFFEFARRNATYIIDMFFFLSGTILSHLYFTTSCQGKWRVLEQLLHFTAVVTYKICSIALPLIAILTSLEISSKLFHETYALQIPSNDHETCVINKWRNILYIDIFFPVADRCMLWSWFVSLEVQFFVVACLILLLAQIHPKYAGTICAVLLTTSIMAATIVEMDQPITRFQHNSDLKEFNLIYDNVCQRISPYLMGMCLGYILYKTRGKYDMNVFIVVLGWIACLLIMLGYVFGCQLRPFDVSPWIRAGIITVAHTVWCMVLFWVVLVTITQYGGVFTKILASKLFYALGKFLNCTILVGPFIIRTVIVSTEGGFHISVGQLIILFTGFTAISLLTAFLLHMLFEAPLLAILRVFYFSRK